MFGRLGRGVVHHPWRVIGLWVVAVVVIVGLSPKLSTTSNEVSFLPSHYQSVQASNLQKKEFPKAATPGALVVFEGDHGQPLTTADSATVGSIARRLAAKHIPTLGAVQAAPPSSNGLVQLIAIQMANVEGQLSKAQTDAIGVLRNDLSQMVAGTHLKAGVTGIAAQKVDQQQSGKRASEVVAFATIGLILLLLLLIFRSPIIALLPVVTIGIVSQVADGLIASLSKGLGLNIDDTVTTLLIVVLFGVGTDYILFLLFRYRERIRSGEDASAAMVSALERVGPAIATAAGAVIIAFLALSLSSLSLFRSLGPALAIAVATTLVAGLTLIPAVVSLLGTKVFWPSRAWRTEPTRARFSALGTALGRHPARFAVATGAVLAALAVAAFSFHPTFDLNSGKTTATQSSRFNTVLLRGYPAGAAQPTDVYLESTTAAPVPTAPLAAYGRRLAAVPGVASVAAPTVAPDGRAVDFRVVLSDAPGSNAAMDTVRGPLQQAADAAPDGTRPLIGGLTSVYVDLEQAMGHDYALVFPVAAVLILLILALLLRSVVAPWYLMAAVGLGFAATLGTTVLVFQNAASESGLTFILPIVMYLFVVALGTDYNILMVSRLREEATEGLPPGSAAAMAVRHSGPTIASAGLILSGTFASLMLAGGTTLVQMGFAIAFGIAMAAFVMAMFLTPSVTALLGRRAWWPGHRPDGGPPLPPEETPPVLVGTSGGPTAR